jgi:hypothetical protein
MNNTPNDSAAYLPLADSLHSTLDFTDAGYDVPFNGSAAYALETRKVSPKGRNNCCNNALLRGKIVLKFV